MKRSCLAFLALSSCGPFLGAAPAPAPTVIQVADWRIPDAIKDSKGVTIPDKTGNGYDFTLTSGARIVDDPELTPNTKALAIDGSCEGARLPINLVEMPDLIFSVKIKPSPDCTGNIDIIHALNRWTLRYASSRKSVALFVSPTGGDGTSVGRLVLEREIVPNAWNLITVHLNSSQVSLRVGDQISSSNSPWPAPLHVIPIQNGPAVFLRSEKNAKFIGSLSGLILNYTQKK